MPVLCAFDGQHTVTQVMEMARAATSLPEAVRSALVEQVIPSCFYFTN
jgi:hypothetical protein